MSGCVVACVRVGLLQGSFVVADCLFFNRVASSGKHSTHHAGTATQLFSGGQLPARHLHTCISTQVHKALPDLSCHMWQLSRVNTPPLPTLPRARAPTHSRPCRCCCAPRQLPTDPRPRPTHSRPCPAVAAAALPVSFPLTQPARLSRSCCHASRVQSLVCGGVTP